MISRRSTLVLVLAGAAIGLVGWLVIHSREPSYQGKPLSIWLEGARGEIHDLVEETGDTGNAKAIRAIGTAALPQLIRMVGTRDSSFRRMLTQLATDQPSLKIHIRPLKELQEEGACGFIVLGPTGKAAVRPLVSLLDDDDADVPKYAAFCLGKIKSSDAVPALSRIQFGRSAAGLVATSEIIRCLSDPSNLVRENASNTLRRLVPEVAAKAGIQ